MAAPKHSRYNARSERVKWTKTGELASPPPAPQVLWSKVLAAIESPKDADAVARSLKVSRRRVKTTLKMLAAEGCATSGA